MHELSIANNLVDVVLQHIQGIGCAKVERIHLKIGALSCIHRDALLFSFDLVTADTPLAGAQLQIESLPIVIYCNVCAATQTLPGVQSFRCPQCNTPSSDIRQGRELDIDSIEYVEVDSRPIDTPIPEGSSS